MYPCGTAIELLRSTYEADYNFNFQFPRTFHAKWFFCAEGAKFLDVPTCFNSYSWRDRREREKDEDVPGEIASTRKWCPDRPPQGEDGQVYCGAADEWNGTAYHSSKGLQRNITGTPICCGAEPLTGVDASVGLNFATLDGTWTAVSHPRPIMLNRASSFPFNLLLAGVPQGWSWWPYDVHLIVDDLFGLDSLPPASESDFPGYAPIEFQTSAPVPDPFGTDTMVINCGPFHYELAMSDEGTEGVAAGYCVVDQTGLIMWYEVWGYDVTLVNPGDFVDISFPCYAAFDYA